MDASPGQNPDPQTDAVFNALAHPVRRRVLDLLTASPGMSVKGVASHFEMSRIGVMKHLSALERAGLVLSERDGRTRRLYFNVIPIQQIYDRWTDDYSSFWAGRMTDVQARVQANEKAKETKRA